MHPPLTTRPGAAPRPGFAAPVWREAPAIPANTLRWNPAIPVGAPYWRQIGLAGPLVGVHGDHLLVGGGANFPEPGRTANEPNTLGKVFWNELFVLDLARETWLARPFALDRALAYAATLSLPEGVLVIGGEGFAGGPNGTRLGPLEKFADVSLLSFDPARAALACTEYPALPAASSYGAAALLGRTAYYQTGGDFLALDLDRPGEGWRVLPSWPGAPRDAAVAAAVGGRIVIATGQTRAGEGWHIHTDAFAYDPARAT
ncbi:MAG: galactose oxidase, partial [Rhodobacteraceae bacterium]|nr:galactose oxidase [Paracoccaceae bacterium]